MPDERAKGKMGPPAYDASLRQVRDAAERSELATQSDESPRPLPEGEPSAPPKRSPGHESPESPK